MLSQHSKLRQEDCEYQVSMGYTERPCLKTNKTPQDYIHLQVCGGPRTTSAVILRKWSVSGERPLAGLELINELWAWGWGD